MFDNTFYHEIVRKTVVSFGTLFNSLYIVRTNNQGVVTQRMKVPLAYGPKQKFLVRLEQDPQRQGTKTTAITLPRIGFEMTGLTYDPGRKLNRIQTYKKTKGSDKKSQLKQYMPVPYNVNFSLFVMAKNSDDALQIVEQILPTFNPQYALTIKPFQTEFPNFKEDIQVIINGVSFSDDFEGAMEQRRTIIYSMDFEMKLSYHGSIADNAIIRDTRTKFFDIKAGLNDSDIGLETIVVTPNPTNVFGSDDSTFGFTTNILDSVS